MAFSAYAQQTPPPGLSMIRPEDLRTDLYAMADAHFRGRSAGTLDELKAAQWLAEQYRSIGIKPAGDDGTYFQYFNLWRNQLSESTSISLNGRPLQLWKDVAVQLMAPVNLDAPITYLGDAADLDTNTLDVKGKVVALEANEKGLNRNTSLPTWRYNTLNYVKYGGPLLRRGAAAILFIADRVAEEAWADVVENYKRGTYDIDGGANVRVTNKAPVLWVHADAKKEIEGQTGRLKADLRIDHSSYPSVNVVGYIPGKDAKLKSEYVVYSGHTDAHGIRNPVNGDSVYYGADDNASVDVAMLASARAFAKYPGKRSILFISHGAEERGLFGSKYYAAHPTVPIASLVAVLNGDMIGRNATDTASLMGSRPPHRNSIDLVNMAMEANREGPKFVLDSSWDVPGHVEFWYFRSDHVAYARLGIPAIMYSSNLHPEYHTPLDNAAHINYPKLKKMADWMYRTGWKVANAEKRPGGDPQFKLER
jgi:hypothetical protein